MPFNDVKQYKEWKQKVFASYVQGLAAKKTKASIAAPTPGSVGTSGTGNINSPVPAVKPSSDPINPPAEEFKLSLDPKAKPKGQLYLTPTGVFTTTKQEGATPLYWVENPLTKYIELSDKPDYKFGSNSVMPATLNADTYQILNYGLNEKWSPTPDDLFKFPELRQGAVGIQAYLKKLEEENKPPPKSLLEVLVAEDTPVLNVTPLSREEVQAYQAEQKYGGGGGDKTIVTKDGEQWLLTPEERAQLNRGKVRLPGQYTVHIRLGEKDFQPMLLSAKAKTGIDKTMMLMDRPVEGPWQTLSQAAKSNAGADLTLDLARLNIVGTTKVIGQFGALLRIPQAIGMAFNTPVQMVRDLLSKKYDFDAGQYWSNWWDDIKANHIQRYRDLGNAGREVRDSFRRILTGEEETPKTKIEAILSTEFGPALANAMAIQAGGGYVPDMPQIQTEEEKQKIVETAAEIEVKLLQEANSLLNASVDIIQAGTSDAKKLAEAEELTRKAIEIDMRLGYTTDDYGLWSYDPYWSFTEAARPEIKEQMLNVLTVASLQKQAQGLNPHMSEFEVYKIKQLIMDPGIELTGYILGDWTNIIDLTPVVEAIKVARAAKVGAEVGVPILERTLGKAIRSLQGWKFNTFGGKLVEGLAPIEAKYMTETLGGVVSMSALHYGTKSAIKSQAYREAAMANDVFGNLSRTVESVDDFEKAIDNLVSPAELLMDKNTEESVLGMLTLPVTLRGQQAVEIAQIGRVIAPKKWHNTFATVAETVKKSITETAKKQVKRTMKAAGQDVTSEAGKKALDEAVEKIVRSQFNARAVVGPFADAFRKQFLMDNRIWRNSDLLYDGIVGQLVKLSGGKLAEPESKFGNLVRWASQLNNNIMQMWYQGVLSLRPAWVIRNYQDNVGRFIIAGGKFGGDLRQIVSDLPGQVWPAELNQSMQNTVISDPNNIIYRVLTEKQEIRSFFDFFTYRVKEVFKDWSLKPKDNLTALQNVARGAYKIFEAGAINPFRIMSRGVGDWQSYVEFSFRVRLYHTKYIENMATLRPLFEEINLGFLPPHLREYGKALMDAANNDPVRLSELIKLKGATQDAIMASYLIDQKVLDIFGDASPTDVALFFNPIKRKLADLFAAHRANGTMPTGQEISTFMEDIIKQAKDASDNIARVGNEARQNPIDLSKRTTPKENAETIETVLAGAADEGGPPPLKPNGEARKMYDEWKDKGTIPDEAELRRVLEENGITLTEKQKPIKELEKLIKQNDKPVVEPKPMPKKKVTVTSPVAKAPSEAIDDVDAVDLAAHQQVIGAKKGAKDGQWSEAYRVARDAEIRARADLSTKIREIRADLPPELDRAVAQFQLDMSDWMNQSRKLIYALFPFSDEWSTDVHQYLWRRFEIYRTEARKAQAAMINQVSEAMDDMVKTGTKSEKFDVDPLKLFKDGGIDVKTDTTGKFTSIEFTVPVEGQPPRPVSGPHLQRIINQLIPNYDPNLSDLDNLRQTIGLPITRKMEINGIGPDVKVVRHSVNLAHRPDIADMMSSKLPKATMDDFNDVNTFMDVNNSPLVKKKWTVITAEYPMGLDIDKPQKIKQVLADLNFPINEGETPLDALLRYNEIYNANLRKALGDRPIIEVRGNYGKKYPRGKKIVVDGKEVNVGGKPIIERSFLVPGMTDEEALRLGRTYHQDAVLTPGGFIYQDGSVAPVVGPFNAAVESDKAAFDAIDSFFSEIDINGQTVKFQSDLDFDNKITLLHQLRQTANIKLEDVIRRIALAYNDPNGRTMLRGTANPQLINIIKKHIKEVYPDVKFPTSVAKSGKVVESSKMDDLIDTILTLPATADKPPINTPEDFVRLVTDAFNASAERKHSRNLPELTSKLKAEMKKEFIDGWGYSPEYAELQFLGWEAIAEKWAKLTNSTPEEWWWRTYRSASRDLSGSLEGRYLFTQGKEPFWYSPAEKAITEGLKDARYPDGKAVMARLQALGLKKEELSFLGLYEWLEELTPEKLAAGVEVPTQKITTESWAPTKSNKGGSGRLDSSFQNSKLKMEDGSEFTPASAIDAIFYFFDLDPDFRQANNITVDARTYITNELTLDTDAERNLYQSVYSGQRIRNPWETDGNSVTLNFVTKPNFQAPAGGGERLKYMTPMREDLIKLKAYIEAGRTDGFWIDIDKISKQIVESFLTETKHEITPDMVLSYVKNHQLNLQETWMGANYAGSNSLPYEGYSLKRLGLTADEDQYFILVFSFPDLGSYTSGHFSDRIKGYNDVAHIRGFLKIPYDAVPIKTTPKEFLLDAFKSRDMTDFYAGVETIKTILGPGLPEFTESLSKMIQVFDFVTGKDLTIDSKQARKIIRQAGDLYTSGMADNINNATIDKTISNLSDDDVRAMRKAFDAIISYSHNMDSLSEPEHYVKRLIRYATSALDRDSSRFAAPLNILSEIVDDVDTILNNTDDFIFSPMHDEWEKFRRANVNSKLAFVLDELQSDIHEHARDAAKYLRWEIFAEIKNSLHQRAKAKIIKQLYTTQNHELDQILRRALSEAADSAKDSLVKYGYLELPDIIENEMTSVLSQSRLSAKDFDFLNWDTNVINELKKIPVFKTRNADAQQALVAAGEGTATEVDRRSAQTLNDFLEYLQIRVDDGIARFVDDKVKNIQIPDLAENYLKVIGQEETKPGKFRDITINTFKEFMDEWTTPHEKALLNSGGYIQRFEKGWQDAQRNVVRPLKEAMEALIPDSIYHTDEDAKYVLARVLEFVDDEIKQGNNVGSLDFEAQIRDSIQVLSDLYNALPEPARLAPTPEVLNNIENSIGLLYDTLEDAKESLIILKKYQAQGSLKELYPFGATYPELGIKRVVREAVDTGHDCVVWPYGEVHAVHYQNHSFEWEPRGPIDPKTGRPENGYVVRDVQYPGDPNNESKGQWHGPFKTWEEFHAARINPMGTVQDETIWKAIINTPLDGEMTEVMEDINSLNTKYLVKELRDLWDWITPPNEKEIPLSLISDLKPKFNGPIKDLFEGDNRLTGFSNDVYIVIDNVGYSQTNVTKDNIADFIVGFYKKPHGQVPSEVAQLLRRGQSYEPKAWEEILTAAGVPTKVQKMVYKNNLISPMLEGMKNYYDSEMVNYFNKIGKPFGITVADFELPKSVDSRILDVNQVKVVDYNGSYVLEVKNPDTGVLQTIGRSGPWSDGLELFDDISNAKIFNSADEAKNAMDDLVKEYNKGQTITVHGFVFNDEFKKWAAEPKPMFFTDPEGVKRAGTLFDKKGRGSLVGFLKAQNPHDAIHELIHPIIPDAFSEEDWLIMSKWLSELPENQRVVVTADEYRDLHMGHLNNSLTSAEFKKYEKISENIVNGIVRTIVDHSDEIVDSKVRSIFEKIAQFIKKWYEIFVRGQIYEVEVTPEVRRVFLNLMDQLPEEEVPEVVKLSDDMIEAWKAFTLAPDPDGHTVIDIATHANVKWTNPNAFIQSLKDIAATDANANVREFYKVFGNQMEAELLKIQDTIEKAVKTGPTIVPRTKKIVTTPIPKAKLPVEYQSWLSMQQESVRSLTRAINTLVEWKDSLVRSLDEAAQGKPSAFFFSNQPSDTWATLETWANGAARDLQDMINVASRGGTYNNTTLIGALPETNEAMLDYTQWNSWENLMRLIYPFWMFPSRSTVFWAKTIAEHPAIAMWYQKYMMMSEKMSYQNGLVTSRGEPLPSYRGYVKIPGSNLWFNPTAALSFRYVLNPLMGFTSGDNVGISDEDGKEISPLTSAVRELYRVGLDYGFQPSPVLQFLPSVQEGLGVENTSAQTIIPLLELFPLNWRRGLVDKLNIKSPSIRNMIAAEPPWKNYLVENAMLKDTLQDIMLMPEDKDKYMAVMEVRNAFMTVDEFGTPARETNQAWLDARSKLEGTQLWQKWASYFTSFYGKPWTDADDALADLREENNLLRSMINNEIGAYLFDLDPSATKRYENYIHNVYETPEGMLYNLRQSISWVTTEDGVQVTDPMDRLRRINERLSEEVKKENYYNELNNSRTLFEEEMSHVPLGSPYEITQPIRDRYWARNAEINSNPEFAGVEKLSDWNPANKPEDKILDHYRWNWYQDLRGLLKPYDPTAESYSDYKERKAEWEVNFSKYARDLAKKYKETIEADMVNLFPMLGFESYQELEGAPGTGLADRILEQLISETTVEGLDTYYKKNDTIHDALMWAWDELYVNKYWEAVDGKSGDERLMAENQFFALYPSSSITPTMLAEYVLSQPAYAEKGWTVPQLMNEYLQAGFMGIEEAEEESQSDGEKKVSQAYDMLNWADRGDEYSRLLDEIRLMGGSEVADDLELLFTSGGSAILALPKNAERLEALTWAITLAVGNLGIDAPTEAELVVRLEAKEQNELYKSKAMETLGSDIFELSAVYYGLSYSGQAEFRKAYPEDYKRIQALSKFKDTYGEMYPLWKSFYDPSGTSSSSSSSKTKGKKTSSSGGGGGGGWGYSGGGISSVNSGLSDDFLPMGKRYSLDFRALIGGYNLGKGGVTGLPVWPEELIDTLGSVFTGSVSQAISNGSPLSAAEEEYLNAMKTIHPEWTGPLQEIKSAVTKAQNNPSIRAQDAKVERALRREGPSMLGGGGGVNYLETQ